ncbi:hypothetical protein [Pseudofrankia sp. DC12]|uniref:hypothetical protein n=1 Tax=Pseudofrankia sp. DC12 TaxID=683315 RepID=UPI0005F76D6D|nr:hypothetical protein [Pseudofrankia sp. DC12]
MSATEQSPGVVAPFRLGRIGSDDLLETPGTGETTLGPGAGGRLPISARHRRHARRQLPRWPLVLAGYLVLAAVLLRSLWGDPGARGYGVSDATLFAWFIGWVPHAVLHGTNPFVTHLLNAPDGVNIMWSTPVVLLAVLITPVTLLAGPVVALNTLLTLAPAVSAIAAYGAARRWVSVWPAAVAGLLYGFSPYMIGATRGHLHLTFAPFPPLLLMLLHDLFTGRRSARRTGLWLGLLVAAQALVSEELLATGALIGALGVLIAAARNRAAVRAQIGPLARALGWCALVAAVLLAWPLWIQFRGPYRVSGSIQPQDVAVSDLLTFAVPTWAQWLAPHQALAHSHRFTGSPVEVSAYFGVPLLLLLAVLSMRLRRDPVVRVLTPLFVIVALLSLGGHLHLDGRITHIPLPWLVAEKLPVIGNALPSRLALYLTMFAGLALAIWLEQVRSRPVPWRAGAGLLTAAALVPLVPTPMHAHEMRAPAFFTTAAVRVIPPGARVLVAPYPRPDIPAAMLWQAQAGYRFALPGCYCTVPGPDGRSQFHGDASPLTTALLTVEAGTMTPRAALALPGLRQAYRTLHADAVIVGPADHHAELVELVTGLTGHGPVDEPGGVALWAESFSFMQFQHRTSSGT